jgi:hypothetical protein
MRLGWFGKAEDPARTAALSRIREAVRAGLGLDQDATISVSEIACGDPACPGGMETVVLVRGRAAVTAALKLPGEAVSVTDEALAAALEEFRARAAAKGA